MKIIPIIYLIWLQNYGKKRKSQIFPYLMQTRRHRQVSVAGTYLTDETDQSRLYLAFFLNLQNMS